MPKARALGKRAVSPVGSTAEVEQVAGGGDATATAFAEEGHRAEAVAAPFKRPMDVPALAPLKALKVSPSSTAHWVVEAQAAIQRGAASARADPKEPVAQGEAAEVASTQTGEGAPSPREAKARGSDGSEAPSVAEAPQASEVEATEAVVPRTTEATVAGAKAPGTIDAAVAEADMSAVKSAAQEVEVGQALIPPPVQGPSSLQESAREAEVHPISSDDTSRAQEVVDTEVAGTIDQPASTLSEGSSALVWSGSSLGSRLIVLSGQVREQLRGALHTGVKRALAVIASHYISIDLKAISDGYVLPDDDKEADEEVAKLMEVAEGLDTALAKLFEEEVVPPTSSADAGDPEP
ncbi:uncharacterized protein [Miscanthus floridulus]|uniref:uncharacterized protein n=1 Tax=Miscanthus floridulus TaxID=154761 RepID=UPI00345B02BC